MAAPRTTRTHPDRELTALPGRRARTARRWATGLISLIALVGFLIGCPALAWHFLGSPIPATMPSLAQLRHDLFARYDDGVIVFAALRFIIWAGWVVFLGCTLLDTAAQLRRIPAPHLPGLGWMQGTTGPLVAAVILLLGGGPTIASTSLVGPAPTGPAITATAATQPAPTITTAAAGPIETASPAAPYTVQAGDTLWAIAGRHLPATPRHPDPHLRWREIAQLNLDTPQPDGRRLTNPDDIYPGWQLRLPADAIVQPGAAPPPAPTAPTPPAAGAPSPGHNGAGPATPTHPPAAPTHPAPAVAPPASSTPDLPPPPISPPAASTPATTAGPRPTTAAPQPRPATATPTMHPAPDDHATHHRDLLPLWVTSAGLLTAGVALTAASRRRRRDHKVGTDSTPPPPDPALVDLHTGVLAADQVDGVARLDAAVRSLAALHRDPHGGGGPVPQVYLHRVDGTIDAYLREPVPDPPDPWRTATDGRIWVLPPTSVLGELPDIAPPCPALVQIGTTRDGAALYADLETLGVLTLDAGEEGTAGLRGLARAIVVTLALSPLAAMPIVRTFGFDPLGLADDERTHPADSITTLTRHATDDAQRIAAALDATDTPSTFTARARHPHDNWDPVIAVVAADLDAPDRRDLAALARFADGGGRGLALVAPADPDLPATWRLSLASSDPPAWRLDPVGLVIAPVTLAADELAELGALLEDADQPPAPLPVPPADPVPAPFVEPPWQVMVRFVGPLDVVGRDGQTADRSLARERTVEVLAWLAAHRGRTRTDLEAALWPRGIQARSLNNQISRARRILTDLAGEAATAWIPLDRTKISMHPAVLTDLDLIRIRLAHAQAQRDHPDSAIATLTPVLELLRGAPQSLAWLQAELGSALTTTAVAAALLLADLHLTRGDTDTVLAVTARGLTVLPGHPGLFALRIQARAAVGDRAAVRAEYDAYLNAEQADPLYDGDTDRDLEHLFHRLTRQTTSPHTS